MNKKQSKQKQSITWRQTYTCKNYQEKQGNEKKWISLEEEWKDNGKKKHMRSFRTTAHVLSMYVENIWEDKGKISASAPKEWDGRIRKGGFVFLSTLHEFHTSLDWEFIKWECLII